MARKVRTTFLFVVSSLVFFAVLYHHYLPGDISGVSSAVDDGLRPSSLLLSVDTEPEPPPSPPFDDDDDSTISQTSMISIATANLAIRENLSSPTIPPQMSRLITPSSSPVPSLSILMPDWEVFVIVSPNHTPMHFRDPYVCIFDTGEQSPAIPTGKLTFPDRSLFKCELPTRARRRLPFRQPMLWKSSVDVNPPVINSPPPELIRWNFLAYDALTTEDDVIVFVKGLNNRQGINREPTEFTCIFGDDVRTTVTSSMQEVFRCKRPDPTELSLPGGGREERITVSIEIAGPVPVVVPTMAYYYALPRKMTDSVNFQNSEKAKLCACTTVYNVGKFLREWVLYHSRIGVERFIIYDNASDDDLATVVEQLVHDGYDVKTHFWLWPKTQEASFSHSAIYAKDLCSWMMYIDVDEFVYSPSWSNLTHPSKSLLHSLLPNHRKLEEADQSSDKKKIAQISIACYEFGPSNQKSHPVMGVTQGYNCRRRMENRHKSIVFLNAVDPSLLNVIHHFILKQGYRGKKLHAHDMVVNHYKFQAWSEFKAKFRRRVSAYVVDWTKQINPHSNDRTPGLGYSPVEPKGWPEKFCEVYDNGLKDLTWKWFAVESSTPSQYHMAWQR